MGGFCDRGNERSGSTFGECLDLLSNYQLLKNLPAPCSKQFVPHRELRLQYENRPVNNGVDKEPLFIVMVIRYSEW